MTFTLECARLDPMRGSIEVVERKGPGHPDSLCDAAAEAFSRLLSRAHLRQAGRILHHNVVFEASTGELPPANHTSIEVGFAPLSPAEQLALALDRRLGALVRLRPLDASADVEALRAEVEGILGETCAAMPSSGGRSSEAGSG